MEMQRGSECHVAPVSERSDDQSPTVAQVLVPVPELCVGLLHCAVVYLLHRRGGVRVFGGDTLFVTLRVHFRLSEIFVNKQF